MGCSTSTQTSAVDTSRPSAKPEEINGATVTGAAGENGNVAEDSETIPDQTPAPVGDATEPVAAAACTESTVEAVPAEKEPQHAAAALATDTAPAEATPTEAAATPAEATPTEAATPAEATPTEAAATPAEATPTEAATPAEATPTEAATPAEATPTDAATPAEATPTEAAASVEAPAAETSAASQQVGASHLPVHQPHAVFASLCRCGLINVQCESSEKLEHIEGRVQSPAQRRHQLPVTETRRAHEEHLTLCV
ncbi:hypothetical protein D4764_21G0001260 [Takifugu flavidus]|uniref:Uncharacterized protein n=1 Tax=Takifugu flavidus TaxID=433684 RepID=A0A5C6NDS5_9TELE|nr:hypothetical protein D4764_21G0001260 [Takifugu flavidus]